MFYSNSSYPFYALVTLATAMENTGANLAGYEGRYPKDLFNKTVVANGLAMGRVARETDDLVVVFGDSDNSRFDVPESKVALAGGSVVVNEPVEQYAVDRDAPLRRAGRKKVQEQKESGRQEESLSSAGASFRKIPCPLRT